MVSAHIYGGIASILGFIYFKTRVEATIVIPILLTLIGFLLTIRWTYAFEKHRRSVDKIIGELGLSKVKGVNLTMHILAGRFFKVFRTPALFYLFTPSY